MQSLKESSISQIKEIPGLYISDRFAARSSLLLKDLKISHVLSVTQTEDVPKFSANKQSSQEDTYSIIQKQIPIYDDPTEDILIHLQGACTWLDASLKQGGGVLVHCTQGISRSAAFVIAYLMKTHTLTYSTALALARHSRQIIHPNPGFEAQLRIWEFCKFDVFLSGEDGVARKEKKAYRAWKASRDKLLGQGEEAVNKERFKGIAGVVAAFGKRRGEKREESDDGGGKRAEGWKRVGEMEEEWNKRLTRGEGSG